MNVKKELHQHSRRNQSQPKRIAIGLIAKGHSIVTRRILQVIALLPFVFAIPIYAGSIDVCTIGANIHCDFNENGATIGIINPLVDAVPAGTGIFPNWLVGYTFLLEPGTSYAGPADNANISDVVVIHNGFAQLFSVLDPSFATQRNNALALAPIDGVPLNAGQIVGTPFFP